MSKKSLAILILILGIGLIMTGCPKKVVKTEEPTVKLSEEKAKTEAERAKEAKEREARRKEEEAKAEKEKFEKSLTTKKEPGIQGQVSESSLIKDVHFDFDKYDIRPADAEILKANAAVLAKNPNVKIQIEGHCDERGTIEYNLALGERRASSTKTYLVSIGIPANRISTISYGKERPLDPAHNEEAWTKNRRAHTIIVAK